METDTKHYALKANELYPINTKQQIKNASLHWEMFNDKLPVNQLIEYAQNVMTRAEELGAVSEVAPSLKKVAQLDIDNYSEDLEHFLAKRKLFGNVEGDPYKELFEKKAEVSPFIFAQALEHIDIKTGAYKAWGKSLSRPHEVVFSTEKKADWAGVVNHPKLPQILGEEGARALKEMGDTFWNTVPQPVKEEVLNLV